MQIGIIQIKIKNQFKLNLDILLAYIMFIFTIITKLIHDQFKYKIRKSTRYNSYFVPESKKEREIFKTRTEVCLSFLFFFLQHFVFLFSVVSSVHIVIVFQKNLYTKIKAKILFPAIFATAYNNLRYSI